MSRIFVHGLGAVSPAGWGVAALQKSLEDATPLPAQALTRPGWEKPLTVRTVPPPATRLEFLSHARLRRASPMAHYGVAAALEALGPDAALVRAGQISLGVVTCTLTGGISYSRRFYQEVLSDPAMASPMIFPETVFNAPASHLAAYLNSSAINYALVGDAGTFLQGLALAAGWLEDGTVEGCVVIGAEEPDWTSADALRLFDRKAIHASGAGALYLKCDAPAEPAVELAGVTDSFAPTQVPDRREAAHRMRAQLPPGSPDELLCVNERNNPAWQDWPGRIVSTTEILGEGFAAGPAWQCVAASRSIHLGQCAGANASVTGAHVQSIGARFVKHNF